MSQDKIQNRIMGEYSIAKSFKGILRIAHIVDLIQGEPDVFLNPAYYGTPKFKLDISGKSNSSRQIGTQSAVHSLKGAGASSLSISRYEFPQDELRNRRVPMTDSLGNYLNWNVGHDGVTIGSNDMISDNSLVYNQFYQSDYKEYPIYQEKFFPVYNTSTVVIGKINKQHRSDGKTKINQGLLFLQEGSRKPKLIIENLYEKSPDALAHQEVYKVNPQSGALSEKIVKIANYKPHTQVTKTNPDGSVTQKYKKIRTIYNDTKQVVQDYDVLMYQQNDWDYDNYKTRVDGDDTFSIKTEIQPYDNSALYNNKFDNYTQGDLLDCNVDFVNIREYLSKAIQKYLNSTIVEVPTGTVIWQYCSLEKWRSFDDNGDTNDGSYPGNRPALQTRNEQDNPFYSSIIQGVCKKINKIRRNGVKKPEIDENSSLSLDDSGEFLEEIIPLYKRDYVLCDGSRFRLPFYPQAMSNNMAKHRTSFQRFFNLFFTIGYTYTDREKMYPRARYKKCTEFTQDGIKFSPPDEIKNKLLVINRNGKFIIPHKWYSKLCQTYPKDFISNHFGILESVSINVKDFNVLNDSENYGWTGGGALKMEYIHNNSNYDKCLSLNPLFDEDLATMLAINTIYKEFKKHHDETNQYYDYNTLLTILKNNKIQEKHIFNSFTDTNDGVQIPFRYLKQTNKKGNKIYDDVKINIGKEVNSFISEISFFNAESQKLEKRAIYELPMVNFFLMLLDSTTCDDGTLFKYLYSFFCYDFCVPTFLPEDDTPSFLGSGGFIESDEFSNIVRKPFVWKTKFTHSTIPHRHGVFAGKSLLDDTSVAEEVSATKSQDYGYTSSAKYKTSQIPSHYRLGNITTTSSSPIGIGGYWGGQIHPFENYYKKDYPLTYIDDEYDNYIINQHHSKLDEVDIYGMKVNVLTNTGYYMNNVSLGLKEEDNEKDEDEDMSKNDKIRAARRYSWATGGHRELTGNEIQILHYKKVKNQYRGFAALKERVKSIVNGDDIAINDLQPEILGKITFKQNVKYEGTQKLGDSSNYDLTDKSDMQEYYHYQKDSWYGLLPYEDQRFDNSEPNRGLSSEPIPFTGSMKLFYKKMQENQAYGSDKNGNAKFGFFSPEHITMLPLIKL